jgi:hypothetical protein
VRLDLIAHRFALIREFVAKKNLASQQLRTSESRFNILILSRYFYIIIQIILNLLRNPFLFHKMQSFFWCTKNNLYIRREFKTKHKQNGK